MECSKSFTIEVEEVTTCCFALDSSPATAAAPLGAVYATTDDRVVVSLEPEDIAFINATTDLVVSTLNIPGANITMGVYCPSNNRVYFVNNVSPNELLVINPTTMAHIGTIAAPAGIETLREGCYDATNDRIYFPAEAAIGSIDIVRLNPGAGTTDVLVSVADPGLGSHNWGRRADYCADNNTIYIPYWLDDGIGTTTSFFRIYTAAGAFVTAGTIGVGVGSVGEELCYWDDPNSVIYFISDAAVAGAAGARAIEVAGNTFVGSMLTTNNISSGSLSPNCGSLNVLCADGTLDQFSTVDYTDICSTAVAAAATAVTQIASSPTKVYVPDYIALTVDVLAPP